MSTMMGDRSMAEMDEAWDAKSYMSTISKLYGSEMQRTHPTQEAITARIIQHSSFFGVLNTREVHSRLHEVRELVAHFLVDRAMFEPGHYRAT
jgi:hypothetical protein